MKDKTTKRVESLRRMLKTWEQVRSMPVNIQVHYFETLSKLPDNLASEFPSRYDVYHPTVK